MYNRCIYIVINFNKIYVFWCLGDGRGPNKPHPKYLFIIMSFIYVQRCNYNITYTLIDILVFFMKIYIEDGFNLEELPTIYMISGVWGIVWTPYVF